MKSGKFVRVGFALFGWYKLLGELMLLPLIIQHEKTVENRIDWKIIVAVRKSDSGLF